MALYKLEWENTGFESRGEMVIEVKDELIREYTSVVNAGIAMVLAKAAVLLIEAENGETSPEAFMTKGLSLKVS
jgi:hypothetical protein